jgi:hypothetical protein
MRRFALQPTCNQVATKLQGKYILIRYFEKKPQIIELKWKNQRFISK